MINCPNCGRPVPDNQRFCGNCGTDVQAALASRAQAQNPPAAPSASTPASTYGYEPNYYDYSPAPPRRPAMPIVWLIVAGVAILCLCCGLIIGGLAAYAFFPYQSVPSPSPSPTPEGLNLIRFLLNV